MLDYQTYARKPFEVKAVQVTEENIEEVAKMTGEIKHKDDGTPYILADERVIDVSKMPRVYLGFWVTKVGEHVRCFTRRSFREQFVAVNDETKTWIESLKHG